MIEPRLVSVAERIELFLRTRGCTHEFIGDELWFRSLDHRLHWRAPWPVTMGQFADAVLDFTAHNATLARPRLTFPTEALCG